MIETPKVTNTSTNASIQVDPVVIQRDPGLKGCPLECVENDPTRLVPVAGASWMIIQSPTGFWKRRQMRQTRARQREASARHRLLKEKSTVLPQLAQCSIREHLPNRSHTSISSHTWTLSLLLVATALTQYHRFDWITIGMTSLGLTILPIMIYWYRRLEYKYRLTYDNPCPCLRDGSDCIGAPYCTFAVQLAMKPKAPKNVWVQS
jgi:hypothetical protein